MRKLNREKIFGLLISQFGMVQIWCPRTPRNVTDRGTSFHWNAIGRFPLAFAGPPNRNHVEPGLESSAQVVATEWSEGIPRDRLRSAPTGQCLHRWAEFG